MKIIFAIIALAFMVIPAHAITCIPTDGLPGVIASKGYIVIWNGLGSQGDGYSIIVDPKTGQWVATATSPDGKQTCFVAEGVKQKLVGGGA